MVWCQNCLLVFPLRSGGSVLAGLIALYSIAGSVFLFLKGEYLYFTYPEPQLYGGIGIAVGILSVVHILAYSNRSYMWTRLLFILGPFVLFLGAVRAGFMVWRLDYYQANIIWECNHGGQLYNATLVNLTQSDPTYNITNDTGSTIPTGFCSTGFHSVYLAFAFALVIDMILQLYQYFCIYRFKATLEEYSALMQKNNNIYTSA